MVGYLSQVMSLGTAIAVFSAIAFGLMIVMLLTLPETRGRSLASLEAEPARLPGRRNNFRRAAVRDDRFGAFEAFWGGVRRNSRKPGRGLARAERTPAVAWPIRESRAASGQLQNDSWPPRCAGWAGSRAPRLQRTAHAIQHWNWPAELRSASPPWAGS
jgi:hypothetical protein